MVTLTPNTCIYTGMEWTAQLIIAWQKWILGVWKSPLLVLMFSKDQFSGWYSYGISMELYSACFEMKGKDGVFQLMRYIFLTLFVLVFRLDSCVVLYIYVYSLRCRSWFWKSFSFVLQVHHHCRNRFRTTCIIFILYLS